MREVGAMAGVRVDEEKDPHSDDCVGLLLLTRCYGVMVNAALLTSMNVPSVVIMRMV